MVYVLLFKVNTNCSQTRSMRLHMQYADMQSDDVWLWVLHLFFHCVLIQVYFSVYLDLTFVWVVLNMFHWSCDWVGSDQVTLSLHMHVALSVALMCKVLNFNVSPINLNNQTFTWQFVLGSCELLALSQYIL